MYFNAYHYRWTIARMAPISELALAASRLAHVGAQIAARIRRHRWHDVTSLRAIRAFVTSMGAACSLSSDSELEAYANDFDLVVDDCEVVGPPPSSARKIIEAVEAYVARDRGPTLDECRRKFTGISVGRSCNVVESSDDEGNAITICEPFGPSTIVPVIA